MASSPNYVLTKLHNALRILATSPEGVRERVTVAADEVGASMVGGWDSDLGRLCRSIHDDWRTANARGATVEECVRIADRILNAFFEASRACDGRG